MAIIIVFSAPRLQFRHKIFLFAIFLCKKKKNQLKKKIIYPEKKIFKKLIHLNPIYGKIIIDSSRQTIRTSQGGLQTKMKKNRKYFTTGEFARIFGIKKQTLFHYDHCGIFKPDIINENGYRYYSFTQLETFAVILMLRELDVHIDEIKNHMDHRSPESLITLLESKCTQIDEKIDYLNWARNCIENKIKITREGINAPIGEVIFTNDYDEYLVTTDYKGADDEKAVTEAVGDHFAFCQRMGLKSSYPIGAVIPRSSITETGYKYAQFYTAVRPEELTAAGYAGAVLDQGGNFLAIYDNHGYANIHANCLKLMEYAEAHNLTLGDRFYEDVILDDLSTDGYYNYLVKLSIKVK